MRARGDSSEQSKLDATSHIDSVLEIEKHAARLTQHGLLTPAAACDVQRALEHALRNSREARCALIALVQGLLYSLDHALLPPDLFTLDPRRQVATFRISPVLGFLVEARLLSQFSLPQTKRVLHHAEQWFPKSGIGGYGKRYTFALGKRHFGLCLDLARARQFTK